MKPITFLSYAGRVSTKLPTSGGLTVGGVRSYVLSGKNVPLAFHLIPFSAPNSSYSASEKS